MADVNYKNSMIYDTSELEVLMSLKRNIFKSLKVASIGKVKDIRDDEALVTLFPTYKNEVEISIWARIAKSVTVEVDDIVVILFLDRNFKQSLKQTLREEQRTLLEVNNIQLHEYNNGIIIANINRQSGGGINMIPITDEEIEECFR